ncbi:MAG: hypothetical protein EOO73_30615 [Myxococcales bacterium]|nr:MAG: hypothetical protein EOO73_30615 [Myxococcales bacterium]
MVISSASSSELSADVSLENLRKRAKTLVKAHAAGEAEAHQRVHAVLPEHAGALKLHHAQLVVAREHGVPSWPKLVAQLDARRPERRIGREGNRVWLRDMPRLRWGASPEPTYIGALEAAFRGSERPLDLLNAMGDSGLCFRVRWAQREQGNAWCGSGPCGEWPEEVAALNAATGYVVAWNDLDPEDTRERVKTSIDRGYPVLAMPSHLDVGVVFGYEEDGEVLLVADYWASQFPELRRISDMLKIGCFVDRVEAPSSRAAAVRAGLSLAIARYRQGVVDPDPITGAAHHYGSAGFERWIADLQRAPELSEKQLANLYHVSSWTFSGLHHGRTKHAVDYLRRAASHFEAEGRAQLLEATELYAAVKDRLGPWDTSDARFGMVKQKPIATWTDDVRRSEVELLREVAQLEERAMASIERALRA